MSIFVALDLSDPVRAEVERAVMSLSARPGKWVPPEKWHLTLVFWGQPRPEALAVAPEALSAVALAQAPFELQLRGVDRFATRRAPSVLWLGLAGALHSAGQLVNVCAEVLAIPLERPWVPHVTLARGPSPNVFDLNVAALEDFESSRFIAAHMTLYESLNGRFTSLERFRFGAQSHQRD